MAIETLKFSNFIIRMTRGGVVYSQTLFAIHSHKPGSPRLQGGDVFWVYCPASSAIFSALS